MYQNDFPIRFSTGNRELSIPKDFDIGLFIKDSYNNIKYNRNYTQLFIYYLLNSILKL